MREQRLLPSKDYCIIHRTNIVFLSFASIDGESLGIEGRTCGTPTSPRPSRLQTDILHHTLVAVPRNWAPTSICWTIIEVRIFSSVGDVAFIQFANAGRSLGSSWTRDESLNICLPRSLSSCFVYFLCLPLLNLRVHCLSLLFCPFFTNCRFYLPSRASAFPFNIESLS